MTEIDTTLGSALWAALRADMLRHEGRQIGVHASASDPEGAHGRPTMMTVVGHRTGPSLLRLETTWDEGEGGARLNEATRYWLVATAQEER